MRAMRRTARAPRRGSRQVRRALSACLLRTLAPQPNDVAQTSVSGFRCAAPALAPQRGYQPFLHATEGAVGKDGDYVAFGGVLLRGLDQRFQVGEGLGVFAAGDQIEREFVGVEPFVRAESVASEGCQEHDVRCREGADVVVLVKLATRSRAPCLEQREQLALGVTA